MNRTFYPKLDEGVYREILPNGLTVMVNPRPGFQRKVAYFVTNYGSIDTSFVLDGELVKTPEGVAHYLEHKMFDLPGRDVSAEFAALGANPNAFTSYDMTAYYFSCTENFEQCLHLLLEFVSTPYFTQESVDKERGIIAQEILMYADNPDSRVFEDLMELMYHHHPVRRSIAGTVESIEQITPETLYQCHRGFYSPENMLLCVCGDVDPEQVSAIARNILPEHPAPGAVRATLPHEPMTCPGKERHRQMEVSMPSFQLGFKCPAGLTGETFAQWELTAELAVEALLGESSQLYARLYEQGLIDSSFGGGVETIDGCAMVVCGGDSDSPEAVRDAILEQARQLCQTGIPDQQLRRMKRSILGRRLKDLDSFESTCFRLCAYHFDGYDYMNFPETFTAVEPEALTAFLKENITPERCAMAVVLPMDKR